MLSKGVLSARLFSLIYG
ncbi:protein YchT [Escherichia coli]